MCQRYSRRSRHHDLNLDSSKRIGYALRASAASAERRQLLTFLAPVWGMQLVTGIAKSSRGFYNPSLTQLVIVAAGCP